VYYMYYTNARSTLQGPLSYYISINAMEEAIFDYHLPAHIT